jgi:hypothetical protein
MSAEIRHSQELLLLLGKHTAEERLAAFLLGLSQQFSKRNYSATDFYLAISRSDIGNYLGIAEETVCRIFSRLEDDGLISSECRHVKLNDLGRLQQVANHRLPPEGSFSQRYLQQREAGHSDGPMATATPHPQFFVRNPRRRLRISISCHHL